MKRREGGWMDPQKEIQFRAIDITADDGSVLFSLRDMGKGSIEIRTGMYSKHEGIMFGSRLLIKPLTSNTIEISREPYQK